MKSLFPIIKKLCAWAVFAFMIWGLWVLRDKLGSSLVGVNYSLLALAALVAAIYLYLNASVWSLALRMLGEKVTRHQAASLWLNCEAMRWLPGGIWGYASRVVEGKQIGVNKTRAGLSLGLELLITVFSWGLISLLGTLCSPLLRSSFPVYWQKVFSEGKLAETPLLGLLIIAVLIAVALFLLIALRKKLFGFIERLRGEVVEPNAGVRALFEYLALNLFYTLGFYFCLRAVAVEPLPSFAAAAGAYALSWIGGFFAIGAPGGMGVREGLLYLIFKPLETFSGNAGSGMAESIVVAAILWRVIQIIIEMLWLLVVRAIDSRKVGEATVVKL